MLKRIVNFLGNYFLFGNFLAALGAAGLAHSTVYILQLEASAYELLSIDLFVFAAVLLVYNADRLIAARYDRHSKRHYWIKKNRSVLAATAILTLPILAWFIFILPIEAVIMAMLLGMLTFAYSFPLIFNYHRSLKETSIVKVFLIALVWCLATTLLPAFAMGYSVHLPQIFLLAGERFLFVLPIAILSDMRDMRTDKAAMIETLPLRYGWRKTIKGCIYLVLLFMAMVLINYWNKFVPLALPHLLSGLYLLVLVLVWGHRRKEVYYTGLADGAVLLQALLILLFNTF